MDRRNPEQDQPPAGLAGVPILSDRPTDRDALDFQPYVNALVNIIRSGDTETPLTIGVFGDWGAGKTSLMRMAQAGVRDFPTVWFDAWKYDKEDALWRALLMRVLNAVEDVVRSAAPAEGAAKEEKRQHEESLQVIEDLKVSLYRTVQREEAGRVELNWEKLLTGSLEAAVQITLAAVPGLNLVQKVRESIGGEAGSAAPGKLLSALERASTEVYVQHIVSLEQFQERFQFVVETYIQTRGKLVVFIDDLDRCLPEKALEVLEAVKLFLDVPGCVFLLGLDDRVIARGIELKYRELRSRSGAEGPIIDGAEYLEKIVQLPFRIPPIEPGEMDSFVAQLVAEWPHEDCPRVFSLGLGHNPRQVKRTVNVFLLLWNLVREREEKLGGAIQPVRLAKVVTLQNAHPDLYAVLQETPRLLRDLEEYYWDDFDAQQAGAGEGRPEARRVEPPPRLALFANRESLRNLLTMHPRGLKGANFAGHDLLQLESYFYLTRRAEGTRVSEGSSGSQTAAFLPQLVQIPAGPFTMGSNPAQVEAAVANGLDPDLAASEQPQHIVSLVAFEIGRYPVTQQEYRAYVREAGASPPVGWDGDAFPPGRGDHPVVGVSWDDAMAYCRWLEEKTGEPYTLPSEAEWEKAARGDVDDRFYPWGHTYDPRRANTKETGLGGTSQVGRFSPQGDSPYGCADMCGNIWEWTRSAWMDYPYDPGGAAEDTEASGPRVMRGGSFKQGALEARVTFRGWSAGEMREGAVGFRVVLNRNLREVRLS